VNSNYRKIKGEVHAEKVEGFGGEAINNCKVLKGKKKKRHHELGNEKAEISSKRST